jgi:hypothetical protein
MPAASTANASGQTLIGASGTVYVSTTGTPTITAPTTTVSAADSDLVQVGFITPDGITFRDSKDTGELKAWQTPYPVRRFVTGRLFEAEFAMQQWNWHTLPIALGGGTITDTANDYKYSPPDADDLDTRAVLIDWVDGTRLYRLWIPSAMVTSPVEVNIKRDDGANFPIVMGAIFDGTNPPFNIWSNDAAFEVA